MKNLFQLFKSRIESPTLLEVAVLLIFSGTIISLIGEYIISRPVNTYIQIFSGAICILLVFFSIKAITNWAINFTNNKL